MPLHIWYVDDEPDLCEIFSETFSSDSVHVRAFTDPNEAVKAAKGSITPDLIFLDYRMHSTNGDLVAQLMDPNIPKYLISGEISVSTTYKFIEIFSKPYHEEEIFRVIAEYSSRAA
jgi:DNA-binding NtrC family response regulator